MDVGSIIAIVVTGLLGIVGVTKWGKVRKIMHIIKVITEALSDKTLTKEESAEIWGLIKEL